MCNLMRLCFSDEERRANQEAISSLRERIYLLEADLYIINSELDAVTALIESGVDVVSANNKFREVSHNRDLVTGKLTELRGELLQLLVDSL